MFFWKNLFFLFYIKHVVYVFYILRRQKVFTSNEMRENRKIMGFTFLIYIGFYVFIINFSVNIMYRKNLYFTILDFFFYIIPYKNRLTCSYTLITLITLTRDDVPLRYYFNIRPMFLCGTKFSYIFSFILFHVFSKVLINIIFIFYHTI